ncbi:MAG: hypothetical protein H0W62_05580 [Chitinophagales bacterium]|nr:hypothetical protein [Chitinophagales bacterium]
MFVQFNKKRVAFENAFFALLKRISLPLAKTSFFIVFFWFGLLKILQLSPAENVMHTLYEHTFWFIPWNVFVLLFGAYEMLIGVIFLFPQKEKYALYMLVPHMITTFGPLVILPALVWKGFMVPNLIGQYIIKNLVIIALAIFIAAYVAESKEKKNSTLI